MIYRHLSPQVLPLLPALALGSRRVRGAARLSVWAEGEETSLGLPAEEEGWPATLTAPSLTGHDATTCPGRLASGQAWPLRAFPPGHAA